MPPLWNYLVGEPGYPSPPYEALMGDGAPWLKDVLEYPALTICPSNRLQQGALNAIPPRMPNT